MFTLLHRTDIVRLRIFSAALFVFLILIFVFNFLGFTEEWYLKFWWYDIVMHYAGGAWLGAAFLYISERAGRKSSFTLFSLTIFLVMVLAVGALWELFEYSVDIYAFQKYTFSTVPEKIRIDTLSDLMNDLSGSLVFFGVRYFVGKKSGQ